MNQNPPFPRDRLLLGPETRVTCPHCEREFSLSEGFAKHSLETLAKAGEEAIAGERNSAVAALKQALKERDERHAAALAEMRALEQSSAAAQLKALQDMLAERDGRLRALLTEQQELAKRAQALDLREQSLADQIAREARQ